MSIYVVDASVAVKWLVPDIHTVHAFRLLGEFNTLLVPDFIYIEVGNVIWKKVKRGQLTTHEGRERVRSLLAIPLLVVPAERVFEAAYELAIALDCTVYDSLYLAMAVQGEIPLVTADQRFHNTVQASRYAGRSLWIEDVP